MPTLWIQSRVNYINNLPQILSKTTQQQQAQPSLQHPLKGLDSSKLEHHLVQQKRIFRVGPVEICIIDAHPPLGVRLGDHYHVGQPHGISGFSDEPSR